MAKKKIKKFLKNAAPLLGAAGLAMMLGGRKGKAFTNANARITGQSVMASPDLNTGAFDLGFKKGGRVGCGVAKKGFGKAMKKRRK